MAAADMENLITKLLNQQNTFMQNMLEQQRTWMEQVALAVQDTVNVPAFYAFGKSKDEWETFNLQLEQHFKAHNIND